MTNQEFFESEGRDPDSGFFVYDWYAMGCTFFDQPVHKDGELLLGVRSLATIDLASYYIMHATHQAKSASPVTSQEIIDHFTALFAKHRPPRIGIVISHSVWVSSQTFFTDPDLISRSDVIEDLELSFSEMDDTDKLRILDWASGLEIRCEFDGNKVSAA